VVFAVGCWRCWGRSRALVAFLGLYLVLVLAWPYAPDRFVWGVWPLIGIVFACGVFAIFEVSRDTAQPRGARVAAATLLVVATGAAVGLGSYSARGVGRGWVDIAQRRNAERLAPTVAWVLANTPANAVVATDGEPLVYLYTGRRVVPVHILSPVEYVSRPRLDEVEADLMALITAGQATHLVLSGGSPELRAARRLEASGRSHRLSPLGTLPGGGAAWRIGSP